MKYEINSSNEIDIWNFVKISLYGVPQKNQEPPRANMRIEQWTKVGRKIISAMQTSVNGYIEDLEDLWVLSSH